ncbi:MAG: fasciclin domain-containing protein [Ferruginibacter sp.]
MIQLINKFKITGLLVLSALLVCFSSCNKDLEQFTEQPLIPPSGLALGETIAATPGDSLYYRLIVKSGMLPVINNKTASYTMFVPDNTGMKIFINAISGGAVPLAAPDAVFSGFITANIPAASAAGIVSYNTISQTITSAKVPASFPNFQLPTQIILPQAPPVNSFIRLTTFPAAVTQLAYVNNIPVTAIDAPAANGVIHHVYTVVAPPTTVLAGLIYPDPDLSYFSAAIARGDSGQVGLNRFDSLFKYGVTNMTVLAPNNAAFQTLIYGTAYGFALSQGAPPALADAQGKGAVALGPGIFTNPAFFGLLPAASVRGILAYHILASNSSGSYKPDIRVFSVNFKATNPPGFVKTLVNGAVAAHPGILVQPTFTGPAVTSLKFTGLGTFPPGGTFYSGTAATAVSMDKHAVNGVLHIIDNVLLPQ